MSIAPTARPVPGADPRRSVAVVVPCLDEEATVGDVVRSFRAAMPDARVVVVDNDSDDRTADEAIAAGAELLREPRRGKGHAVARALERVDADILVLVDGDATYPADEVDRLLAPILAGRADHVVGRRVAERPDTAFPRFHGVGNRGATFLVNRVFGTRLSDVLSGYRAFTRDVARCVPLRSAGFDVETEFTLQTLDRGFVLAEVPVSYVGRPAGSRSKLSTFRDGARVLRRLLAVVRDTRPLLFFSVIAGVAFLASAWAGAAPIADYLRERYVHHLPRAVLAAALAVAGTGLWCTGLVLDAIQARFRELHLLRRRDLAGDVSGRKPPLT